MDKTQAAGPTAAQVLELSRSYWRKSRVVCYVAAALSLAGIVAFLVRASGVPAERSSWGYFAAVWAFLLATAGSAPVVAVGLRMTSADWRRPLTRAMELYALPGLLVLLMFIPLSALLPSEPGQPFLWHGWPFAPRFYDTLAVIGLVGCGLMLLLVSALPDLAALAGGRAAKEGRLAIWRGSARQWKMHRAALSLLGAFYLAMLVLVQALIASDYVEAFVPGWKDPLFPMQQLMVDIQAGFALAVITMGLLRKIGVKEFVPDRYFWSMGKIMIALSLLWFYFWFSGLIVMWYGRMPVERNLLDLLWFGPYLPLFYATLAFNFIVPLFVLMWNPLRRTVRWPVLVSAFILVGTLLERIRFFVAAYSVTDPGPSLTVVPQAQLPDLVDLFIVIGGISGAAFIYMLMTCVIPPLATWEVREGTMFKARSKLVKLGVWVVGKAR
ncbi:MAG: hypothetical protein HYX90_05585 [Chloroflexi bacterium]|nr:hypothetical protein [Chloroflexota bacterium]